ncbi:hypothetical protein E2C01_064962 [Portunus trituberculatus]|uniref:Uncharacterized protein n=1 Tax=Portunus trituberculatus TaxID=210409 RepID=A0A5B7HPU5_PORTR|nr:hypothetical protein [Portunus trituberculatus]
MHAYWHCFSEVECDVIFSSLGKEIIKDSLLWSGIVETECNGTDIHMYQPFVCVPKNVISEDKAAEGNATCRDKHGKWSRCAMERSLVTIAKQVCTLVFNFELI